MIRLMLSDCQSYLDGELFGDDVQLSGFSIDTRTLQPGDLYIAIKGDRFDGHEYCRAAEEKGASGLLVHTPIDSGLPQLKVDDTRIGLGLLAKMWAEQFQVPTVAVTGSNGKTTVKEMVAAILGQLGPVLSTEGNYNNDIGVPLTLLRLRNHHQYAVIEIGANHVGEVAMLSRLVQPDVALVNNVGEAHLEGFGSIEAIAQAKSEIYQGLSSDGWAVINADDKFADDMRAAAAHCHQREFGSDEQSAVRLLPEPQLQINTGEKTLSPRFALLGRHNRLNAVAATAVAQCMDVQPVAIMSGLAQILPVAGRLQTKHGYNGSTIIDDTYNANPTSVRAAIDVLIEQSGTRVLVLGDLAELGADEQELHAQLGEYAKAAGVDKLLTLGNLSQHASNAFAGAQHFEHSAQLVADLRALMNSDITVLVKGSRGSRMELIVNPLVESSPRKEPVVEVDSAEVSEVISL